MLLHRATHLVHGLVRLRVRGHGLDPVLEVPLTPYVSAEVADYSVGDLDAEGGNFGSQTIGDD